MMQESSFRSVLMRYTPLIAVTLALALVLMLVPSRFSADSQQNLGSGGLAGTSQNGGSGTGSAPGGPGGGSTSAGPLSSGPGSSTSGGPAAGANTTGAAAAGKPDCSRDALLGDYTYGGNTCRPPKFVGSNGGVTYAGVTATQVNVVIYRPEQNQQSQSLLQQAGTPTDAQVQQALTAWEAYINAHFEFYGRHVKLIFQKGPGTSATDPAQQQADATTAAVDNKAFFVGTISSSLAFHDELARRKVPSIGQLQLDPREYASRAPYFFGTLPDLTYTLQHVAEYYCKRMNGRAAAFAGDPTYQSTTRKIGIIWLDNGENSGPQLQQMLQHCGANLGPVLSYTGDQTTLAQQATNIVAKMHSANVTTVTCLCDLLSPAVITNQAASQGWQPEWLQNAVGGTDIVAAGRLYNQAEWSHSFGLSESQYPVSDCDAAWWKAFAAGGGGDPSQIGNAGKLAFSQVMTAAVGIEAAGPDLTAQSFAQGLFNTPQNGGKGNDWRLSFGNRGPSPYTLIDDLQEIWYSSTQSWVDGKPGTFFYVNGGKRYLLGQYPTGQPHVLVNDGSPQPPRDPCGG